MANEAMDFSDERGKLFVGGLSWETTQENLQNYFSRFGEVVDCVVMKNNDTGRSRGFGFVTFADPNNVESVLNNGPHELDGRTIDPKPCNPRYMAKAQKGGSYPKVFLGGLPANVTETDLRQFFCRFGKVMEVVIMYDQERKKSRGFGFLSFEDESSVERVTSKHYVQLHGKQVEVKKAEPREGAGYNKTGDRSGGMRGPHGFSNGQMGAGGPHMSHPGNMQGFQQQGWGAPPQQQGYGAYNYGAPSGPQSYQGWGAPQGPPQQQGWGSFSGPHGQPNAPYGTAAATGYGTGGYDMYGQATGQNASAAGSNWNYSSWPPQGSNSAPTPPSDPTGGALAHGGGPDYGAYGSGAGGAGTGAYNAFGNYGIDQGSTPSPYYNGPPHRAGGGGGSGSSNTSKQGE